jgi:hypothetical protein
MKIWIDVSIFSYNACFCGNEWRKLMAEMMSIDIFKSDFNRLKAIAEPLVDTPASIVSRILDAYQVYEMPEPKHLSDEQLPMVFSVIPPMTHTKLLGAQIENRAPEKVNWDGLLRLALEIGLEKLGGFSDLKRVSGANMLQARKSDDGYKFVERLGFSYQGVSAEDALKIVERISKSLSLQWRIEFEWRDKPDAFLPGQRATLGMAFGLMTGGSMRDWKAQ